MADYDLSTYEGRQEARDAGNWVGDDGNGNIVMESGSGGGGGGGGGGDSGGGGGGGGGEPVYQTRNGPRTKSQMEQELRNVGWGGNGDVAQVYAQTTGGAVTDSSGGVASTGGSGAQTARDGQTFGGQSADTQATFTAVYGDQAESQWVAQHNAQLGTPAGAAAAAAAAAKPGAATPTGTGSPTPVVPQPNRLVPDVANANAAADRALQAAYYAYLNGKLALDTDDLAFRKAQQAFAEGISEANLLGTYEGQQTLAAKAQEFSQGITAAGVTGMYQGSPTLQAQQQYFTQGLESEKLQQSSAQAYLNLIAGLRGPQDYGQYLKTMANTPEGLRSLVNAAANTQGRLGMGGTGVNPVPVSLQDLTGPIGQGNVGYGNIGGAQYSGLTQQQLSDVAAKYKAAQGADAQSSEQLMAWYSQNGGGGTPWTGQAPNTAGGTSYADYMAQANALPAPSQIAPQNFNAMTDTQRQLLMGMYEQRGWNVTDAMDQYKASLPKYGAANSANVGSLKLV